MESRIKIEALYTINQQLLGTESGKDNKMRRLFTGACWLESEPVLDHTIPGQEQKGGAGQRPHTGSTLGKSLAVFTYEPNSSKKKIWSLLYESICNVHIRNRRSSLRFILHPNQISWLVRFRFRSSSTGPHNFFFFFWEKAEGTLLRHWRVGIAVGAVGLQLGTFLTPQCPDLPFCRLC